jgi:Peptidase M50B-like
MTASHELGHVLGAWLTGGRVELVVLHPLAISRTDVRPNPRPLVVAWMGPTVGAVLPAMVFLVCRAFSSVPRDLARFFAGACLMANGLYLGIGTFDEIGDAGELLRHGASLWQLCLFGAVACPLGLWLWSGTGPTFGFGTGGHVSRSATWVLLLSSVAVAVVLSAISER